jgi:hypothetical protein
MLGSGVAGAVKANAGGETSIADTSHITSRCCSVRYATKPFAGGEAMKNVITWRAFLIAASLMAIAQFGRTIGTHGLGNVAAVTEFVAAVLAGGVFWGIVGVWIARRYKKDPSEPR